MKHEKVSFEQLTGKGNYVLEVQLLYLKTQ